MHGTGQILDPGDPFTVLSWNIQFAAGRNRCFFYDGGPDSRVSEAEVQDSLEGIGDLIASQDPDLVLLQEVDRNSTRTCGIDQIQALARRVGLPVVASTPYFKVPWVPVPQHQPMGRVDMHLVVLSRYRLSNARRIALSALREPLYRRIFNLRRALMQLELETADGAGLDLFQTHLSAFSHGDGTLDRQVQTVLKATLCSERALLVGDFNSLPVGVDPKTLGDAQVLYPEGDTPIRPLTERLRLLMDPLPTYVPFGSNRADRTIDYAFAQGPVEVIEAGVIEAGARWSDHLPLRLRLRI